MVFKFKLYAGNYRTEIDNNNRDIYFINQRR